MIKKLATTNFSQALRDARINAKLSATDLARAIGRTQSYISQLESGALHPPDNPERIEEIAASLNCDPVDLFLAAGRLPPNAEKKAIQAYYIDRDACEQNWHKITSTASTDVALNVKVDQDPSSNPFDDRSQSPKNVGAENV